MTKVKISKKKEQLLKAKDLIAELENKAENKKYINNRPVLQRFFKTGKGEYAEGDIFLGLPVPLVRSFAKKYQSLTLTEVKKLLNNKFHEVRLVGLLILVEKYKQTKTREEKTDIVGFYLQHSHKINNWDLVDLSCYKILGDYLLEEAPKKAMMVLSKLAESKNMWERRIAMVSTFAFIKSGRKDEVINIAKKLLQDSEDLIHKASGWMLRELGKRVDQKSLFTFLDTHAKKMPRVALRYAVEKVDKAKKMYY